jgi:hypothetical protein
MAHGFSRALPGAGAAIMTVLFAFPIAAQTLPHRAENQVPVAIVKIDRAPDHTAIHIQAQAALAKVCFPAKGANSPYLLANGRNYRYLGGDNVSACPERRDYTAAEVMVLRFEPLEVGSSTFSFVSGQTDGKQSTDAISPTTPYWSFIRVRLD